VGSVEDRPLTATESIRRLLDRALRGPALLLTASSAVGLALLALAVTGRGQLQVDVTVASWIITLTEPIEPIVDVVDDAGDAGAACTTSQILALVLFIQGSRRAALLAVAGQVAASTLALAVKVVVGRTFDGELSFPSGHVTASTAIALTVALVAVAHHPHSRPVAAAASCGVGAVALLMSITVVAGEVHYMTDAVGGALTAVIGVLGTALTIDAVGLPPDVADE
jgi:membrane-associated phospholipid phosphatase